MLVGYVITSQVVNRELHTRLAPQTVGAGGKHRAAAQDVMRALRIEPSSKALLAQQQRILAALRSAAADAPFVSVRAAEAS